MKYFWLFLVLLVSSVIGASIGYFLSEDYFITLIEEDGPIENLNALLFFVASVTGMYFYFKSTVNRKILLFLSVLSFVGFLDELSFGARIFDISAPLVFGASLDAVHDIFYLGMKVFYHAAITYPLYTILFLLFLGAILSFILYKYRSEVLKLFTGLYQNKPVFLLASFFAGLIVLALIIDLEQIQNNYLYLIEEIFELNAGSAILFMILSLKQDQPDLVASKTVS